MARNFSAGEKDSGVVPRLGEHRRYARRRVDVVADGERSRRHQAGDIFRIELIDAAEASKLAFEPVIKSVMIRVAADEAAAADLIVGLDALHDVDWKRQPGDPRRSRCLIRQIEFRRRCVFDARLRARMVHDAFEQVGLPPAHEVDITQLPSLLARQRRRPYKTRRAAAKKIHHVDRCEIIDGGERIDPPRGAPAVARLVEKYLDRGCWPRYTMSDVPEPSVSARRMRRWSKRSAVSNQGERSMVIFAPKRP